MSYEAYYAFEDGRAVEEADEVASGDGWVNWGEWVLEQEGFSECHCLYVNGWANMDGLAEELEQIAEIGDEDQKHITARILEVIRDAPEDANAIVISNGIESDDDEDEDD